MARTDLASYPLSQVMGHFVEVLGAAPADTTWLAAFFEGVMRLTVVRLNVPSVTALSRALCCWTARP